MTRAHSAIARGDTAPSGPLRVHKVHREQDWKVPLLRLLTLVVVLLAWQVCSGRLIPKYIVSNPVAVAKSLATLLSTRAGWADVQTTGVEILLAFIVGVAGGAVLALFLGSFVLAGKVLEPLVAAVNGIPKVALAPLFLIFFGVGTGSKVAIGATMVAFVVFYNLYYGMRTISNTLDQLIRLMGGRRRDVLVYLTVPSLVSPFFAGLKAGGPLAIIGVIVGEFLASFNGIGHQLFLDGNDLNTAGVFAGIVLLVAMALILNGILNLLDSIVSRRLGAVDARKTSQFVVPTESGGQLMRDISNDGGIVPPPRTAR